MKVTIDWLKKYTEFALAPNDLAQQLTMTGLEVENINEVTYDFENIVVGEIVYILKHEQKENLNICAVNIGKEIINVVCGAPNIAVGLKVPVAVVGAKLPDGRIIEVADIHGFNSPGMICSEAELGLSHQSDTIMVLHTDGEMGQDLKSVLGRGEVVIELNITPNRPDCLGVIGIAREIAAVNQTSIQKPPVTVTESSSKAISEVIEVVINNPESCPRYTARYIEGVRIGPSPRWLVNKLKAVGLRSINNIVDVTNFVMMETGQPLHAFDYDLLEDHKIVVRHAEEGEKFITLDEKEHLLSDNMLMICDGKKPIALAGIMGGLNSEISDKTTTVLLESAYFNPPNIRRTSKKLGISTDSSQRFERGIDPEGLIYALDRASQLINEVAGGEIASGYIDCYPSPISPITIELRVKRVNHLLGTSIKAKEIAAILESLEFKTRTNKDTIQVQVPSFRVDIEREVDLIEEIARIYGFDQITEETHTSIPYIQTETKFEKFCQLLRELIIGMGYSEVLTHSLIHQNRAEKFSEEACIQLKNPISEELGTLRPSLIPGLFQVVKWNKNRYLNDQKLFEIGNIFYWETNDQLAHQEQQKISLIRTGNTSAKNWIEPTRPVTFYDLKGDIFSLLDRLQVRNFRYEKTSLKFLDPRRAIALFLNDTQFGYLGAVSEELLNELDISEDIIVSELDFQVLSEVFSWEKKFRPIPKYPAIRRDLSIVVDEHIPLVEIEKLIRETGGKFLKTIAVFDFYRGQQVAKEKKSLGFSLTYYSLDRTLTEKEVDTDVERIVHQLRSRLDVRLRA